MASNRLTAVVDDRDLTVRFVRKDLDSAMDAIWDLADDHVPDGYRHQASRLERRTGHAGYNCTVTWRHNDRRHPALDAASAERRFERWM